MPSTESDRKAFAFDILPSAILDNLIIYKTATPDKSGDFAGGIIDIATKSTSPKNFTLISFGTSYNSLLTGNTRYFSENKGKKDWIGIDDGIRSIPSALPVSLNGLSTAQKVEAAKHFSNYRWGIQQRITQLNYNLQLSKGFNIHRRQKEFIGALLSFNYARNFTFNPGQRGTYDYDSNPNSPLQKRNSYNDSTYNEEVILAALANISVKVNKRNSISWKNNFSINADNKIIKRIGAPDFTTDPTFFTKDRVRWFTSNQIFSSQLNGDHLVGSKKTKINWLGSYSKVIREVPDFSRTSYIGTPPNVTAFFPNGQPNPIIGSGTMLFTGSNENIKSFKTEITQPYTLMKNTQNFIKIGGGYQSRSRDFTTRLLGLAPYSNNGVVFDNTLLELPEDQLFLPEHFGVMKNGKGGFLLDEGFISNSNYKASSDLAHGYIMSDQRFFKKFRLIYGLRVESFNQKLKTVNVGPGGSPAISLDTKVTDVLPSVNFVYALTNKMNVRLSYSQTINRPEFRELAPYLFFDYVGQYSIEGDTGLQRAEIKNYDLRYEIFPGKAQLFSVSAFYKEFKKPIEIIFIPGTTNQAAYANAASAKVYGVEAEFRALLSTLIGIKNESSILTKFTLTLNAALMESSVKLGKVGLFDISRFATDRPLQGQSPYLINGSLGFNDDETGVSATFSANRVGDRLFIAGIKDETADIYEKARTVLDFQLTKSFMNNALEIKFNARDILSQDISFYSDFDLSKSYTDRDKFFSTFKSPKVFSLSLTCKF